MQTTTKLLFLENKLGDDQQCSSITKGSILLYQKKAHYRSCVDVIHVADINTANWYYNSNT